MDEPERDAIVDGTRKEKKHERNDDDQRDRVETWE
jgi:hypothetical protein